jgi:hypothetical protein
MTRTERLKVRRRMHRRIRLAVEERRMALALGPYPPAELTPEPPPAETPEPAV